MDVDEDDDRDDKVDDDRVEHDDAPPPVSSSITKRQSIFIWSTLERSLNYTAFVKSNHN